MSRMKGRGMRVEEYDWIVSNRIGLDLTGSDRVESDRIGSGRIWSDRIEEGGGGARTRSRGGGGKEKDEDEDEMDGVARCFSLSHHSRLIDIHLKSHAIAGLLAVPSIAITAFFLSPAPALDVK